MQCRDSVQLSAWLYRCDTEANCRCQLDTMEMVADGEMEGGACK